MIQDIAIQYECSADKQAMFDNVEQHFENTQLLASSNSTISIDMSSSGLVGKGP